MAEEEVTVLRPRRTLASAGDGPPAEERRGLQQRDAARDRRSLGRPEGAQPCQTQAGLLTSRTGADLCCFTPVKGGVSLQPRQEANAAPSRARVWTRTHSHLQTQSHTHTDPHTPASSHARPLPPPHSLTHAHSHAGL